MLITMWSQSNYMVICAWESTAEFHSLKQDSVEDSEGSTSVRTDIGLLYMIYEKAFFTRKAKM